MQRSRNNFQKFPRGAKATAKNSYYILQRTYQPSPKGWAKTFPLFSKSGAKTFIKINYLVCE